MRDKNRRLVYTKLLSEGQTTAEVNLQYSTQAITATAAQTVFGLSTAYTPGNNSLAVYHNGSRLIVGQDYTETTSTSITLAIGATAGDVLQFVTATPINPSSLGSASVAYVPAGAGAVATNVQTKLRETVSVEGYGVNGIDDAPAFTLALSTGAKRVYALGPSYKLNSTVIIPPNVELICSGQNSTIITITSNVVGFIVQSYSKLQGFRLTKSGTHTNNGIEIGSLTLDGGRSIIQQVWVDGVGNDGIQIRKGNLGTIRDVVCTSNGRDGINFTTETVDNNAWKLEGFIDVRGNSRDGINFAMGSSASDAYASKSHSADLIIAQQNGRYGIYSGTRSNVLVAYAEANVTKDVFLDSYAYGNAITLVEGQTYTDNGQRNLFSSQSANADYFRAYKGKVQFQGGSGKGVRVDNSDGVAGTLDIEKTGLRAYSLITGSSSANQQVSIEHEQTPTYVANLALDGVLTLGSKTLSSDKVTSYFNGSSLNGAGFHDIASASGSGFIYFRIGAIGSATTIGSIARVGTTSAVVYNTTSDARLKQNITSAPDSGSVIDSMKVRSFNWRCDETLVKFGFIAQELIEASPEAVTVGGDDELDQPWQIDLSKLVPVLVKEVQMLRARVLQLELKNE